MMDVLGHVHVERGRETKVEKGGKEGGGEREKELILWKGAHFASVSH